MIKKILWYQISWDRLGLDSLVTASFLDNPKE